MNALSSVQTFAVRDGISCFVDTPALPRGLARSSLGSSGGRALGTAELPKDILAETPARSFSSKERYPIHVGTSSSSTGSRL